MNVNLTPQLEDLVRQKVASGLYNNASEVVREALRLMEYRDRVEFVRAEVAKGFQELDNGQSSPLDMEKIKRTARKNAKAGHTVNPLVTP